MTRTERINKLANAIKAYRGSYNPETKKWIRPPQPDKRANVIKWLHSLAHHPNVITAELNIIDGFKNHDEFRNWIKKL